MNKSDLWQSAIDIVVEKENNYWTWRLEEADERDNWMTKRQRKMLKDSDNHQFNVKKEYAILIAKQEKNKKAKTKRVEAPKKKWFNHIGVKWRYVLLEEITEDMKEKEDQWGIEYADYLHDLK